MEKKYKLTEETLEIEGHVLNRIIALRDFGEVKKGDLGGFIEKESNLSHDWTCWIYNDAVVRGNAMVYGDAKVYGNAEVYGNAMVYGDAKVYGNAEVYGEATVCGNAEVHGEATVCGEAMVYGNAMVYGEATVCGNAEVYGEAMVCGNAEVYGNAMVYGNAKVCGNAKVEKKSDYIVFKNWWSSGRYFTWTRSNDMWSVGCFYGTGEELIKKAYKNSEEKGREYARIVKYVKSIK